MTGSLIEDELLRSHQAKAAVVSYLFAAVGVRLAGPGHAAADAAIRTQIYAIWVQISSDELFMSFNNQFSSWPVCIYNELTLRGIKFSELRLMPRSLSTSASSGGRSKTTCGVRARLVDDLVGYFNFSSRFLSLCILRFASTFALEDSVLWACSRSFFVRST